jgi:hypothetical protein
MVGKESLGDDELIPPVAAVAGTPLLALAIGI